MKRVSHSEEGFVLLLTMLIMSVTLAISFSIYTLSIKEVVLGSYMRESEKAFMAADRALECALFWDRALPPQPGALAWTIFATSSTWVAPPNINTATCNNGTTNVQLNTLASWSVPAADISSTTGRTLYTNTFSEGTSADVEVYKQDINTTITSNGYNTSVTTSSRRTQRTLVARYNL